MFCRKGSPLDLVGRVVTGFGREGGPLGLVGRAIHWVW